MYRALLARCLSGLKGAPFQALLGILSQVQAFRAQPIRRMMLSAIQGNHLPDCLTLPLDSRRYLAYRHYLDESEKHIEQSNVLWQKLSKKYGLDLTAKRAVINRETREITMKD